MSVYVCVILAYYSGMQSASFLRSVTLSSVAYLALPYSSTLSHKRHGFWKIFMEQKKLIFSTAISETLLFLSRIPLRVIINVQRFIFKEPIILARF
jgi:hypothetical protein